MSCDCCATSSTTPPATPHTASRSPSGTRTPGSSSRRTTTDRACPPRAPSASSNASSGSTTPAPATTAAPAWASPSPATWPNDTEALSPPDPRRMLPATPSPSAHPGRGMTRSPPDMVLTHAWPVETPGQTGIGTWRSLVAHLTGGQGVAGSNPVVPTGFHAGRGRFRRCEKTAFSALRGVLVAARSPPFASGTRARCAAAYAHGLAHTPVRAPSLCGRPRTEDPRGK